MPTTNMGMTLPSVSVTVGPTYATQINTALDVIDDHDHSSGNGVLITPAGLNINADLNFNSNDPYNLRSARFDTQSAALAVGTDIRCVYVVNGDLYYNNSSGTAVQITSGSGLNASSIGGIGGDYATSTASVSYSNTTKVFSFTQSSGVTAFIACGSLKIYENVSSANPVTLASPTSLAGAVTSTLPSVTGTLATLANTSQTFAGATTFSNATLTFSALTASRLLALDGSKVLASVTSLTSWIAGTSNQITVTDDGDGTLTLSLPSTIAISGAASPYLSITDTTNSASIKLQSDDTHNYIIGDGPGTTQYLYIQTNGGGTTGIRITKDGSVNFLTNHVYAQGVFSIDVDGTALNSAGSITVGVAGDGGMFFNGTDLIIISDGAGASGIIFDSEDDTFEFKGSGTLQATFDTNGLNLVSGDYYSINGTSVLNATTLGSAVVASSLTSVGTLSALTVTGEIVANGGVDVASGQVYQINNTSVLSATTLGTAVVASSLTSVGTLTSLTVSGTATIQTALHVGTSQLNRILAGSGTAVALVGTYAIELGSNVNTCGILNIAVWDTGNATIRTTRIYPIAGRTGDAIPTIGTALVTDDGAGAAVNWTVAATDFNTFTVSNLSAGDVTIDWSYSGLY